MRFFGWLTGGLGVSGALVAAASALLLALSAAVAFHGWPDRLVPGGSGASPIEIAIAQPAAERGRRQARIPAVPRDVASAAATPRHGRGGAGRSASPSRRAVRHRGVAPGSRRSPASPPSTGTTAPAPSTSVLRTPSASAPAASSGGTTTTPRVVPPVVQPPAPHVPALPPPAAAPAVQAVQGVTQAAGQAAQGVADGVGGALRPVSPPAADAVGQVGATAGDAVQGVGQAVSGLARGLPAPPLGG